MPKKQVFANETFDTDLDTKTPPDGGMRAWMIVVAAFLVNGIVFGVINSYSIIYTVLEKHIHQEGIPNPESKAGKL